MWFGPQANNADCWDICQHIG